MMEFFFHPDVAVAVLIYAVAFTVVVFTITSAIKYLRGDL